LDYLKAVELQARIEYTFPQFVPTLLPMRNGNYGVQLERMVFKRDAYDGIEYDIFMSEAKKHGWEIDLPDNGMLILPMSQTLLVTSLGQWELYMMVEGYKDTSPKNRGGRPRKDAAKIPETPQEAHVAGIIHRLVS